MVENRYMNPTTPLFPISIFDQEKTTMDKCEVILNLLLQTSFVLPNLNYVFHLYFSSFLSI